MKGVPNNSDAPPRARPLRLQMDLLQARPVRGMFRNERGDGMRSCPLAPEGELLLGHDSRY
eukprot:3836755-Pyramimonas_sp.AAC.1